MVGNTCLIGTGTLHSLVTGSVDIAAPLYDAFMFLPAA